MTTTDGIDRQRLLARHGAAWDALLEPFTGIDETTATRAPRGEWSAADHLVHAAVWERHRLAVLRGEDPAAAVGVSAAEWAAQDEDAMNALISARWAGRPLPEILAEVATVRDALAEALANEPAARLATPYRTLHPDDDDRGDGPAGAWAVGIAEVHIDAHLADIRSLLMRARGEAPPTVAEALRRFDAATDEVFALLDGASDDAASRRDAGGWSLADNAQHLAAWDRGMAALLRDEPRRQAMGISAADWADGFERINEVLHSRHAGAPLAEATAALRDSRADFRAAIADLEDIHLLRGYSAFDSSTPASDFEDDGEPPGFEFRPILAWIAGNGWEHPEEHLPAMRELAHR